MYSLDLVGDAHHCLELNSEDDHRHRHEALQLRMAVGIALLERVGRVEIVDDDGGALADGLAPDSGLVAELVVSGGGVSDRGSCP